jgi:hypothetical protein
LIVAMMVLIALTLIVISGSHNGVMQLRMSSNLESRVEAVQTAQAALDFVDGIDPATITTDLGNLCYGDTSAFYTQSLITYASTCVSTFTLPSPINTKTGLVLVLDEAEEQRLRGSSGDFTGYYFPVYSTYDNSAAGQGRATLGAGSMKIIIDPPTS